MHLVQSGVPQGSVLGPLLFILFINDLPEKCLINEVDVKMFADDVKLAHSYKPISVSNPLMVSLMELELWSKLWNTKIAPTKSQVLYLGKNNPRCNYTINGQIVPQQKCVRDLGILIDDQLKFDQHISKVIQSVYYKINLLSRTLHSNNPATWCLAYKSYIRPLLEYATEVWNPTTKDRIHRIERVQKYFTRKILQRCGLPKSEYNSRLSILNLESLVIRRRIADLTMAYKIITRKTHLDPSKIFLFSLRSVHSRKHQLQLRSKPRNAKSAKSFANRITSDWNMLDADIVLSNTPVSFKQKLRKTFSSTLMVYTT